MDLRSTTQEGMEEASYHWDCELHEGRRHVLLISVSPGANHSARRVVDA